MTDEDELGVTVHALPMAWSLQDTARLRQWLESCQDCECRSCDKLRTELARRERTRR